MLFRCCLLSLDRHKNGRGNKCSFRNKVVLFWINNKIMAKLSSCGGNLYICDPIWKNESEVTF